MRLLLAFFLLACSASDPAPEAAEPIGGDETGGAETPVGPAPAVAAARLLIAYQALSDPYADRPESTAPANADPTELADAIGLVAEPFDAVPLTATLHAAADSLRQPMGERDVRETVDLAIARLWQVIHEMPVASANGCDVARVLALRGLDIWRAELTRRFEQESLAIDSSDFDPSVRADCDDQDEECSYRWSATRAHWLAFDSSGPIAQLEEAMQTGRAETAAAIETHLDASRPIFRLLQSPRPQRPQVADLAPLCAM